MRKILKTKIKLFSLFILWLFNFPAYSAFTVIQNLDFSEVLPVVGSCSIDVDSTILTGTICTGSTGDVGHYRITTTPNTVVTITIYSKSDSGDGIVFHPTGKISTDSSADVNILINTALSVNSGTSGEIDIYLAGEFTLMSNQSFGTTYSPSFEIEYN